jgi:hypothetical protein
LPPNIEERTITPKTPAASVLIPIGPKHGSGIPSDESRLKQLPADVAADAAVLVVGAVDRIGVAVVVGAGVVTVLVPLVVPLVELDGGGTYAAFAAAFAAVYAAVCARILIGPAGC